MSVKVTRPPPAKGPQFPSRHLKAVSADDPVPVRANVRGHYWGDKEVRRFHIVYIVAIAGLVLTAAAAWSGARHVILSQMTASKLCSTIGKSDRMDYATLWLEQQPGWETPRERTDLMELCYERSKLF